MLIITRALTLLLVLVTLSSAGLVLSYGSLVPTGTWASNQYQGGVAYALSGEWTLMPNLALALPQLSYSELGYDAALPRFLKDNYDLDTTSYGRIKSNMWNAGGSLKFIMFPKAVLTPTIGMGYAFFSRGVTVNGVPLPGIPQLPTLPSHMNASGGGFVLSYGVKLVNDWNLSLDMESRNFWAKGIGNSELEQMMGIAPRTAAGFQFLAGLEFF
jgi:hypothetical protein